MSSHVDDLQLSRLVDGDLSLAAREAITNHLRGCPACAVRHDQIVSAAALLRLEPAVRWSTAETALVMADIAPPRRSFWPAVAAAVSVALCVLAIVAAAPLMAPALAFVKVFAVIAGGPSPGAVGIVVPQLVTAVLAVAILAPLAAYPLARWR